MSRRLTVITLGFSLVLSLAALNSGCSDPGQPARESISAPRKGGGLEDAGPAGKGKKAATGKIGGKGGEL
ncbi:MAG: hypothetical protein U0790_26690 [Isosphaeraceae bacterium]